MTKIFNTDGKILHEGTGSFKDKINLKGANLEDDCSVG